MLRRSDITAREMKGPDDFGPQSRMSPSGLVDVLNMDLDGFSRFVAEECPMPNGGELYSDELARLHALFQTVAEIIRRTNWGIPAEDLADKFNADIWQVLGEEHGFRPQLMVVSDPASDPDWIGSVVMVVWMVRRTDSVAYIPDGLARVLVAALEYFALEQGTYLAACSAPAKRHPERRCGRIFERVNERAIYCSPACRTRASRARTRDLQQ